MADLLDRAKKVLFPEASSPVVKAPKRRARGTAHSCSLATAIGATLSNSELSSMVDKENQFSKSLGTNHTMDSIAVGMLQNGQNRGFRSKVERGSLESTRSIKSRLRQTDSLATLDKAENECIDNNTNTSVVSSMDEARERRRRGRSNLVSSLAHTGNSSSGLTDTKRSNTATAFHINQRRKPVVSSLMNLSSSTQKPRAKSKNGSTNQPKNDWDLIHNIQCMTLNDGHNRSFSSPVVPKQRPFVTSGECTSPPEVLHRLSSLSDNFFSPSKTPGSVKVRRKRMDKKKTPVKFTAGFADALNGVTMGQNGPSPIVTELSISPQIRRRKMKDKNKNNAKHLAGKQTEFNDCKTVPVCEDVIVKSSSINLSHLVASPPVSTKNQADKLGDNGLLHAKASLFPTANEQHDKSITATEENIQDSSVGFVEVTTPRLIKPTSLLNGASEGDANGSGNKTRGSLVLSLQKAPPMSKVLRTEPKSFLCDEKKETTQKGKNGQKTQCLSDSSKSSTSLSRQIELVANADLGTRKSARESKQTDRFTVESWDNVNGKGRKLEIDDASGVLSSDVKLELSMARQVIKKSGINVADRNIISYQAHTIVEGDDSNLSDNKVSVEDKHWSAEELSLLREAQNTVDPTLSSYWREIATIVDSKTAPECREKWFSLVATPRGLQKKENKVQHLVLKTKSTSPTDASEDEEDDLFHSTPMRETLHDVSNKTFSKQLNQSCLVGPSFGISPRAQFNAANQLPGSTCLNTRRVGYKTYVDKLRKDLNPSQNNTKKATQHTALQGYAYLHQGDWGKVMEDETVHLTFYEEIGQDDDDIFDEDNED